MKHGEQDERAEKTGQNGSKASKHSEHVKQGRSTKQHAVKHKVPEPKLYPTPLFLLCRILLLLDTFKEETISILFPPRTKKKT